MRPRATRALICRIDVAAFVAVMFALVFLLMAPTQSYHPRGPSADLPHATNPSLLVKANREDALNVAVTRDGQIYFMDRKVLASELPQKIRDQIRLGAEQRIYFSADARARYGDVVIALDAVRASGIKNVSFLAWKAPASEPPVK